MANVSGDSPLINPDNPSKLDQQSASSPSFPNTRWMKITTDFSRNPGIFDDVFKKIKGKFLSYFHLFVLKRNL